MRLLAGCLLCCCSSSAQIIFPVTDSSVVKTIDLPATEPFDTSRAWHRVSSQYVYVISDKDIYDHFGYETDMKFSGFNFANYHILGMQKPNKEWVWVMRENKKAFSEIPLSASPWQEGSDQSRNDHLFFMDTLVKTRAGTGKANWYVTGHGDCMATFKYKLFSDNYHPVLVLAESNFWGGCRAGGSRSYTLSFSMPAGILYTVKNTILMDKEYH